MDFELTKQEVVSSKDEFDFLINITEFKYTEDLPQLNILDNFLHSTHFTYDTRHPNVKQNPELNFLPQPFIARELQLSDFRKLDKAGIEKKILDHCNDPGWEEGIKAQTAFTRVAKIGLDILKEYNTNEIYLINVDWFAENDKRLNESATHYSYYFLIIGMDKNARILHFMEWFAD